MEKNKIQEKIKQKQKEIAELQASLLESDKKVVWIKIPNTQYEIEKEVHHKNKSYDDLKKEFGEEYLEEHLPTLKLLAEIFEHEDLIKKLKMDCSSTKDDFYFKQPIPKNREKGYVARFYAYSDYADLYCVVDSGGSNSYRGVRFVRKVSTSNK